MEKLCENRLLERINKKTIILNFLGIIYDNVTKLKKILVLRDKS
jgi:hypothetical protein